METGRQHTQGPSDLLALALSQAHDGLTEPTAWLHIPQAVSQPSGHGFGGVPYQSNLKVHRVVEYLLRQPFITCSLSLHPEHS